MPQKSKTFKDIKQSIKKRKPSDFIDPNRKIFNEALANAKIKKADK